MKNLHFIVLGSILSGLISISPRLAQNQAAANQPDRRKEHGLEQHLKDQNRISVGTPKLYDETALQQMLSTAQMQLGALQVLNRASLGSGYGAITGANLCTLSLDLNIGPNPARQVATTTTTPASQNTNSKCEKVPGQPLNDTTLTTSLPTLYAVSASGRDSRLGGTLLAIKGDTDPFGAASNLVLGSGMESGDCITVTGTTGNIGALCVIFVKEATPAPGACH